MPEVFKKCPKGHYYRSSKWTPDCPFCKQNSTQKECAHSELLRIGWIIEQLLTKSEEYYKLKDWFIEAYYEELPTYDRRFRTLENEYERLSKQLQALVQDMHSLDFRKKVQSKKQVPSNIEKKQYTEEEEYWSSGGSSRTLPSRITPSQINELEPNEIFVFGSNIQGRHGGGAARVAYNKFGAEWGNGDGLQGQSYALPTMEGLENTELAVERFTLCAKRHPELLFWVTPVGCGIAGYTPEQIAPMFREAAKLDNVYLPLSFWKVLMEMDINQRA